MLPKLFSNYVFWQISSRISCLFTINILFAMEFCQPWGSSIPTPPNPPPPSPTPIPQPSPAVILKNVPEGAHHMSQVAGNLLEMGQLFNSPDQDMGPTNAPGPSMTSPILPLIYKEVQSPGRSEFYKQLPSTQPPSFPALRNQ